ncbi:amino acid transporter AVT1C-like [Homalodisca vitripennis]|nr:amino acid transporter AVT1C-like [Homalodisca vitripennis]KAG8295869.1 hypothetical protein J6590_070749 [Homalodisca vitripennis]
MSTNCSPPSTPPTMASNGTTKEPCEQLPPKQTGVVGGLNILSAAIFVAAEMAGGGILTIPKAVVDCGWIGMVLVVVFCLNAAYGGTRLGECWAIIEERYPHELQGRTRDPYPTIAYKAVGRWGSLLVSICMQCTLFGASVVFLLMSAQIVQELLKEVLPQVGYCKWFLLFAAAITPPMWLGSPKDFWIVGFGAVLATFVGCILIFCQTVIDGIHLTEPVPHNSHSINGFFYAFGTILFSYGGAATFPTIQNDMAHREKFPISAAIGFTIVLSLYMPVVLGGYFVFGDNIKDNILLSLHGGMISTGANILLATHLICAFFIVINPVSQHIEQIFNVPHKFCLKRVVVRTLMVVLMVAVGETIPQFGKILSLVGSSTITLTTFVLPPYFYMRLCDETSPNWPQRKIPLYIRVYMWELIGIGLVGGAVSTYSALQSIVSSETFTKPCYWPD